MNQSAPESSFIRILRSLVRSLLLCSLALNFAAPACFMILDMAPATVTLSYAAFYTFISVMFLYLASMPWIVAYYHRRGEAWRKMLKKELTLGVMVTITFTMFIGFVVLLSRQAEETTLF